MNRDVLNRIQRYTKKKKKKKKKKKFSESLYSVQNIYSDASL